MFQSNSLRYVLGLVWKFLGVKPYFTTFLLTRFSWLFEWNCAIDFKHTSVLVRKMKFGTDINLRWHWKKTEKFSNVENWRVLMFFKFTLVSIYLRKSQTVFFWKKVFEWLSLKTCLLYRSSTFVTYL